MKYGDGAIADNKAGMTKHFKDFQTFISNQNKVDSFKTEMLESLVQKRELGLIPYLSEQNKNEIIEFEEAIDFGFIIANHDPESTHLIKALTQLGNLPGKNNIMFFVSNFYGYGLYVHNKFGYTDFLSKFSSQIHTK